MTLDLLDLEGKCRSMWVCRRQMWVCKVDRDPNPTKILKCFVNRILLYSGYTQEANSRPYLHKVCDKAGNKERPIKLKI